jgi:hypothetical protein
MSEERANGEYLSTDLLASDVLAQMDRIMRDVPDGGYVGDYAEQGRDIWPERWRTLKTWLAHHIMQEANARSHDPSESEVSVDSVVGGDCRTCENNDADVAGDSGACVLGHGLCDPPQKGCHDYRVANAEAESSAGSEE